MLIQMNVCFVYLEYKIASLIDYAYAMSLGTCTLCIQTTSLYSTIDMPLQLVFLFITSGLVLFHVTVSLLNTTVKWWRGGLHNIFIHV